MSGKDRIRRKDGDVRREGLLRAAIEVFAEKGFAQASVRTITTKAGANVSAVKYYFDGKIGLFHAALEEAHLSMIAQEVLPDLETPTPKKALRLWIGWCLRTAMRVETSEQPGAKFLIRTANLPKHELAELGLIGLTERMSQPIQFLVRSLLLRLVPEPVEEKMPQAVGFVMLLMTQFTESPEMLERSGLSFPASLDEIDPLADDLCQFIHTGVLSLLQPSTQSKEPS